MHRPFIKIGPNVNYNSHFFSTEHYLLVRNIVLPNQGTVMRHIKQVLSSKHMTCQDNDQAYESAIEHYQRAESVQFYKRDSRLVQKMAEPWIEPATSCSQVWYTTDWAMGLGSANGCKYIVEFDWMNGLYRRFQQYVSNITLASVPIDAFLEFLNQYSVQYSF